METNPKLLETFDERVIYFLNYIYENGGNEYRANHFDDYTSHHLAGMWTPSQFNNLMKALLSKDWISCESRESIVGGNSWYFGVRLTEKGIVEVQKGLPKIPMIGLVNQEITTGDSKTDEKINHAKNLFFGDPQTMEHMRSACITLAAVLEPLRDDLTPTITSADVNTFFELVNKFDIRHNKGNVKRLEHPEQLEWVFYSLLNTINTYTKLKNRPGNS